MIGTVKWFDAKKGFGFIRPDGDHPEIFVHHSGIKGPRDQNGRKNLSEQQRVEFRIESGDRGPKAVDVRAANDQPHLAPAAPESR